MGLGTGAVKSPLPLVMKRSQENLIPLTIHDRNDNGSYNKNMTIVAIILTIRLIIEVTIVIILAIK